MMPSSCRSFISRFLEFFNSLEFYGSRSCRKESMSITALHIKWAWESQSHTWSAWRASSMMLPVRRASSLSHWGSKSLIGHQLVQHSGIHMSWCERHHWWPTLKTLFRNMQKSKNWLDYEFWKYIKRGKY